MGGKLPDIEVGTRFGLWSTSGPKCKYKNRNNWHYPVVCDCGNKSIVPATHLLNGKATRCQPCAIRISAGPRLSSKQVTLNTVFLDYRKSAKRRGHEFSLTKERVEQLIFRNCFYCDSPPSNTVNDRYSEDRIDKPVPYNGIDRMRNGEGYVYANSVTCCWICNRMKSSLEFDAWVRWIENIIERYPVWGFGD